MASNRKIAIKVLDDIDLRLQQIVVPNLGRLPNSVILRLTELGSDIQAMSQAFADKKADSIELEKENDNTGSDDCNCSACQLRRALESKRKQPTAHVVEIKGDINNLSDLVSKIDKAVSEHIKQGEVNANDTK